MSDPQTQIVQLYNLLHQPDVGNAQEITKVLLDMYTQSPLEIIEILFNIVFCESYQKFIRKHAAIDIDTCFKFLLQNHGPLINLPADFISKIWAQFGHILQNEEDNSLVDLIIKSSSTLFHSGFFLDSINFFLEPLLQKNMHRGLNILCNFIQHKKAFTEYETNLLGTVFMTMISRPISECSDSLSELLSLYKILTRRSILNEEHINCSQSKFQEIYKTLLSSPSLQTLQKLSLFFEPLNKHILPFPLETVEIMFSVISNTTNCSPQFQLYVAMQLALIMAFSKFPLDFEPLLTLFDSTIHLSMSVYNTSTDSNNPDSFLLTELFEQILDRVTGENLGNMVQTRLDSLIQIQSEAAYYTALLIIINVIERTEFKWFETVPTLITFCIESLFHNHAMREIASNLIRTNIMLFIGSIKVNFTEFISRILTLPIDVLSHDLIPLISEILYCLPTESVNSAFGLIYEFSIATLNADQSSAYACDIFYLLGNLYRTISSDCGASSINDTFDFCIKYLDGMTNDNIIVRCDAAISFIFELFGSFAISCPQQTLERFDVIHRYAQALLSTKNSTLYKSITDCYNIMISSIPEAMNPLLPDLLRFYISMCQLDFSSYEQNKQVSIEVFDIEDITDISVFALISGNAKKIIQDLEVHLREVQTECETDAITAFILDIITPSTAFLIELIEVSPGFFSSNSLIFQCLLIVYLCLESLYKDQLLAGIQLLEGLIKNILIPRNDALLLNTCLFFIPILFKLIEVESTKLKDRQFDCITSCFQILILIYNNLGPDIFNFIHPDGTQRSIFDLFNLCLSIAINYRYKQLDELRFEPDLHISIQQTLITILKYFPTNSHYDFSPFQKFIEPLLSLLNHSDPLFHSFAFLILAEYNKHIRVFTEEQIAGLYSKSLECALTYPINISCNFILFIRSLVFNYKDFLKHNIPNLLEMINSLLDDSSEEPLIRLRNEYLIGLFAALDGVENVTNQEMFAKVLRYMPIQCSQRDNNSYIYRYLLNHFQDFLEMQLPVLHCFVGVFSSKRALFKAHLTVPIAQEILKIIVEVIQKQDIIQSFFSNQEDLCCFLETISEYTTQE